MIVPFLFRLHRALGSLGRFGLLENQLLVCFQHSFTVRTRLARQLVIRCAQDFGAGGAHTLKFDPALPPPNLPSNAPAPFTPAFSPPAVNS